MPRWDPDSYLMYQDERTQPSYDLVARIGLDAPASIVDIGCGPGTSTRVLRERWPQARITGLDSSPEMIARAQQTFPQEHWVLADAASWEPGEAFDLVFSNATLQWIPGHERLVTRLFGLARAGGVLAVQIPANYDSPMFLAILQVAAQEPWRALMAGVDRLVTLLPPEFYYDLLSGLSSRVTLWQTIYYHVMPGHQGLIDWYTGTGLRPYLERLPDEAQKSAFKGEVLETCRSAYPLQADGRILFPFKRTFFLAHKNL